MIKKLSNLSKEVVYQNPELGESYRRVVGGLAWPALPEPGYLVVVAEDWSRDDGLKARKLRILAEREAATVAEMYRSCLELRKLFHVGTWRADMENKQEVNLFLRQYLELHFNQDVYLSAAAYSRGDALLGTYAQLILELVQPGRKILRFGEASQLNSYLVTRNPEDMKKPARQFPPLAALGYAAAEIMLREPRGAVEEVKCLTNWDVYNLGGSS